MADDSLFRKSALDKLASPERLDVLMQVTSPQGWIALWTIGLVLVAVVGWSVLGRIGERVNGQGMLIHGEGNRLIRAQGSGFLQKLTIKGGQELKPNDIIANIKAESVADTIRTAQAEFDSVNRENGRRASEDQIRYNSVMQQVRDLETARAKTQATLEAKRANLEERRKMLAANLISRRDVNADELEVSGLERDALNLGQQIATLKSSATTIEQSIRAGSSAVTESKFRLDQTRKQASDILNVMSTYAGRVMAVPKRENDKVERDDVIAAVEETGAPLQAVVFVTDLEGPRIKPGMTVQLDMTPTVRREQYGVLLGTVNSVGQYAATPEEVLSVFANETQAQELLKTGSKFLVRVTLARDPNTPSGFGWSSSSGPSMPIVGGMTISSGAIIVDSRRPVCRVLPIEKLCAS
jgi:HlyD family secretion protein